MPYILSILSTVCTTSIVLVVFSLVNVAIMSLANKSALVSRLTEHVTEEDLRTEFTTFGAVDKVVWCLDEAGEHIGQAVILFGDPAHATEAVQKETVKTWKVEKVTIEQNKLQAMVQDQELQELVVTSFKSFTPAGKLQAWRQLMELDKEDNPLRKKLFELETSVKDSKSATSTPAKTDSEDKSSVRFKVPKLPNFSGDKKSKEATFARWQYNVKILLKGPYDSFAVLNAVNQSLKSPAADMIVNMGPDATVQDILAKFKKRYGCVLPVEALTEKLYALKQGSEDVSTWASILEEVVYQMEEMDGISHNEVPQKVKGRFWRGLKDVHVKEATRSQWADMEFDNLLVMCRTLEEEFAGSSAKVHAQIAQEEDKFGQILKGLQDMNTRMDKLEAAQASTQASQAQAKAKEEKPKEKQPAKCTKCKQEGHLWFGCVKDTDMKCKRCDRVGHLQKSCRVPLN